jgi:hypothetical protein
MVNQTVEHAGSCHCGAVRFTVRLPADLQPRRCNCSICATKGAAMVSVPLADLTITQGEALLTDYRFGSGVARHRFCSRCGIHPFHQMRAMPDHWAINLACVAGIDPYRLTPVPVSDGQHHALDHGGVQRIAGWLRWSEGEQAP